MAAQKKTHCKRGHLRDDEHTFIDSQGWAQCIECRKLRTKKYYRKRRAQGFRMLHGRWVKNDGNK